jgi:hypothetical protein
MRRSRNTRQFFTHQSDVTSMSTPPFFRAIIPDLRIVFPAGVIGTIAGILLYWVVAAGSEATVVIQTGRVGGLETLQTRVTSQLNIERRSSPQMLLDKMQTPSFAKTVALKAGEADVATDFPARQYGGRATLRVRAIGDGSLVEARAMAKTDDLALKLAGLVADQAISEDQAMLSRVRALAQERIQIVEKERETLLALIDAMNSEKDSSHDASFLAKSIDVRTQIHLLSESLWTIQAGLSPPMSQDTKIFSAPSLARPIIRFWWLAACAGLLGGIAFGYTISLALRHSIRQR